MATVALCTPHADLVRPDLYRALLVMQNQFPQHQFIHVEVDTQIVGKARNMLVVAARGVESDLLWFIDNDTLVPPHSGILIEQAMEQGVVSGVYYNRRPPYHPQVYKIAEEPEYEGMYWPVVDYPESGLRQEDAIGAGCFCIRMDIFELLTQRWEPLRERAAEVLRWKRFNGELNEFADIIEKISSWFEFLDRKGEDLYFSERLRAAGIPVWVNYDVKCVHMASVGIVEEHFLALKDQLINAPPEEVLVE